ncbi:type I-E CRISPR-associated protein Cse2/CasB [Selenomonas sp. KH1T6]|uniref:type I-E CRISPR-associated protein Cse2/CasB n=1 Tax=Selenomonas sp. KH1T6 TaxID=3158784 RepID=UPI0008A80A45|nr:CRISPR type I-E/ECOLI-associated protein CasB/Cse2 [Selenomonas ruminantium]
MNEKEKIADWLEKVQIRLEKDKGLRSVLKRAAGKTMPAAGGAAMAAFYKLPPSPSWEQACFTVVCLMCLWEVEDWKKGKNLALAAKNCLPADRRESFGKKLETLMDLSIDEDGYFQSKLYRVIKLIKNKGALVDASQLLYDLVRWESDSRFIQKRWVKEFYQDAKEDESEGEMENVD